MAGNEYDQYFAADAHTTGSANLAGVAEVAPEQGAQAIQHAPTAGTPASQGMYSPEATAEASLNNIQQQYMRASDSVRQWAASADPSHLAVSKDDFPSLARIGSYMRAVVGNPFADFWQAFDTNTMELEAKRKEQFKSGDYVGAAGTFGQAMLSILGSPIAPVNQIIKRAIELDPEVNLTDVRMLPGGGTELVPTLDRAKRAQDWADLATFFLLGAGGRGRFNAPNVNAPPGAPPASPFAQRLPGPNTPRPPAPGINPATDALRTTVAEADVAAVTDIQTAVAESQTHTRSPAVMESYLAQQTGEQTVRVNPDVLMQLGAEGTEVFPDHGPQIIAAARAGEPVEILLSTYLARTAGQPFAEQLNAATSFREGGVSVEDAAELPKPMAEGEAVAAPAPRAEVAVPDDFNPSEAAHTRYIAAEAHNAVDSVVQELRLRELFTEAKAVGATKTNFERYSVGIEEQIAHATERMTARAIASVKRERAPEFKERIAQHVAEVEQEFAQNPAVRARAYVAQGRDALGAPLDNALKLNRADTLALYGRDLGLPDSMFASNGVSPDELADILGYPTGADLIRDLSALHTEQGTRTIVQHMREVIHTEALARTRVDLGYDLSPESLHAAASELLNTPKIEAFLADDLAAFAQEHGLPFDKAATKAFAVERFASRPVKQAINIRQLESFLARDGRKLETALLKGDIPAAFRWKQLQYLHQVELTEAHKFVKFYAKVGRLVTQLSRKRTIKSVADPYLGRAQMLVAEHGVPLKRNYEEVERAVGNVPFPAWAAAQQDAGYSITYNPVPALPLNQLSVEDFKQFARMLQSVVTEGKNAKSALVNGEKQDLDALFQAAADSGNTLPPTPNSNRSRRAKRPESKSIRRGLDASYRSIEDLTDILDRGDPLGPNYRAIIQNSVESANRADDLTRELWNPIVDQFKALPKETREGYLARLPDVPLLDPRDGTPLPLLRGDIPSILANMGTANNLIKLAEGYGTTPEAVLAFVNRYITIEEANMVQHIWDTLSDQLFPLDDEVARRSRGYGLTKEKAIPVRVKTGTLRGGYFPLQYNPLLRVQEPEFPETTDLRQKPFHPLAVPNGATKERTGYTGPILLDLDLVLRSHMEDTVKRIAYTDYIKVARRYVADPRIKQMWLSRLGPEYYAQLTPWLERQVMDMGAPRDLEGVYDLVNKLNHYQTLNVLGGSFSVMVNQLQGAVQVIAELGMLRTIDGYRQFLTSPTSRRQMYKDSGEMRSRFANLNREMRDEFHSQHTLDFELSSYKKAHEKLGQLAIKTVGFADKWFVSGAAYQGAYRKAIQELKMSHGDAVRYAEKVVRQTQGSGRPMALSAVQGSKNPFLRLFSFAITPAQRQYNLNLRVIDMFKQGKFRKGASNFMWLIIGVPLVKAFVDGDWPNEKQRTDPEWMATWFIRNVTLGFLGTHWVSRDVANYAQRSAQDKYARLGSSSIVRAGEAIVNTVKLGKKDAKHWDPSRYIDPRTKNWFKTWINLLSVFGKIPGGGGQLGKSGQFLIDTQTKRAKPETPADWFEGLTSGKVEPRK